MIALVGSYSDLHGCLALRSAQLWRRFSNHRPKCRAKGTPSPATWWSARAGPLPARFQAPWARCSHTVLGLRGKQMVGMILDPRVCGLHSCCVPAQTPVLSCGGPSLDGVGPLPAWHLPCMNEILCRPVFSSSILLNCVLLARTLALSDMTLQSPLQGEK